MAPANTDSIERHPELLAEQDFLDFAQMNLVRMRERAVYLKSLGYQGGNVTEGGVDPDIAAAWDADKQRRIDALADLPTALCFGRLDRRDDTRHYIGRRHVEDAEGEPLVTDWRAPVATGFYRATLADPMGLALRRRFILDDKVLVDIFDEDFTSDHATDAGAGAYVPDPLLAEIEKSRTGEMRDIVATIAAEQDIIIRAPIEECVVVQGGPGTGKTAVGLHRAAFLLYEHSEMLRGERLLILGPNPLFLRYISQVLPSLGETAAVQLTLPGLVAARYRVRAEETAEVARIKGDPRMVAVVRRAVFQRVNAPKEDVTFSCGFGAVTLPAAEVAQLVETSMQSARPANQSREVLRNQLVDLAWQVYATKATTKLADWAPFTDDVRGSAGLKRALDKIWPTMSAADTVRRLYGNRRTLMYATDGVLSDAERDALARKQSSRVSEEQWTRADLGVLDEAEALTSGALARMYEHVVVDEAQDLSALELRMVARRARRGSMTILGDLAQATAPGGQTSWEDALAVMAPPRPRRDELTVGYRVPAPIIDFANRLLPIAAPSLTPTGSVRLRGEAPRLTEVDAEDLPIAAALATQELIGEWNTVGVVAPLSLFDDVAAALASAGVAFTDGRRAAALDDHVTLLAPLSVKGLEFDAVVVIEPAAVVDEDGVRALYIALTRAVQVLSVVNARPLPEALAAG
jgi:DNA helicase IV